MFGIFKRKPKIFKQLPLDKQVRPWEYVDEFILSGHGEALRNADMRWMDRHGKAWIRPESAFYKAQRESLQFQACVIWEKEMKIIVRVYGALHNTGGHP